MNITQQGVIALLKSAITGKKTALPEQFDMAQAYPVLRHHSITAMGYVGAVNCGIDKNLPVMQKLRMDYAACLMNSQGQMREIHRIYQAFDENCIDYMPLKGCNMKAMYPHHELRGMGDADILIRQEQYDKIRPVMEQLGFEEKKETDHELIWESKALYLELHKQLVPTDNQDYYEYYGSGWRFARLQNRCCYAMKDEDQFVFLFIHFSKHYRDFGIGCRHVVDLWVYLRGHTHIDEAYIRKELKKLKLLEFYDNMLRLISAWFCDGAEDCKVELISNVIFANGNWGNAKNHMLSQVVRTKKEGVSAPKGKLLWFVQLIFLPREQMRYRYPVLKKHPYLLPVCWVARWIDIFFHRRNHISINYNKLRKTSEEEIEAREQALAYVGLRFGE